MSYPHNQYNNLQPHSNRQYSYFSDYQQSPPLYSNQLEHWNPPRSTGSVDWPTRIDTTATPTLHIWPYDRDRQWTSTQQSGTQADTDIRAFGVLGPCTFPPNATFTSHASPLPFHPPLQPIQLGSHSMQSSLSISNLVNSTPSLSQSESTAASLLANGALPPCERPTSTIAQSTTLPMPLSTRQPTPPAPTSTIAQSTISLSTRQPTPPAPPPGEIDLEPIEEEDSNPLTEESHYHSTWAERNPGYAVNPPCSHPISHQQHSRAFRAEVSLCHASHRKNLNQELDELCDHLQSCFHEIAEKYGESFPYIRRLFFHSKGAKPE